MSFATSSSAFGIKPSPATGVFGAPTTQPSGPNPTPFNTFGASSSQPSASSSFSGGPGLSLGQNQNQNQTQAQNQTQPGFFGQQPQQSTGNLFGSGSWGNAPTNPTSTSTQPAQSGFGGWGLGSNQSQNLQQQPQSSSLGTGTFFGGGAGNQSQLQPQGGALWGSSAAPGAGQPLFAPTVSAPTAPQQQQQQQQQQQTPTFVRTTKFNDLPDQMQKIFESIDNHIQGRIQISNDLKARSLGEEPTKSAELIRKVHNNLINTMGTLQADKAIVEELKSKVDLSVQDTIIITRIIDGFRNPQQNGAYLKNHAGFPLEYFTRAADEIRQKLQWCKSTMEQIERRLSSAQNQVQYNPQAITATLQAQNATFISLASKTAEMDAELQKVKSIYRELFKAQTGSARDPFNDVDRRSGDGRGLLSKVGSLEINI